MKTELCERSERRLGSESETARERILSRPGEVLVFADWEEAIFLHFSVAPELLAPFVLRPFDLDLFQGKAYVSLVNLTMRRFQPSQVGSIGSLLRFVSQERVLNLRTYVRRGEERGAYFLWGWLSRPGDLPWPSGIFGLPYEFASMKYEHDKDAGKFLGSVISEHDRLGYCASAPPAATPAVCTANSLEEFAMERYAGYYQRNGKVCAFRIWHDPWKQVPIRASIECATLVRSKLPWFERAVLAGASYSPGFQKVWLGRPHATTVNQARRHGLSSFYEMP